MTELEKPSVILRREAEKPVPNWIADALYAEFPANSHTETCRCQLAMLWDYALGAGLGARPRLDSVEIPYELAHFWATQPDVFQEATDLNDRLTKPQDVALDRRIGTYGFFSQQVYRYFQRLAPKRLREVADHYEKHGL